MHFYCNLFLPVLLLLPAWLREAKDTRDVSDDNNNNDDHVDDDQHKVSRRMIQKINIDSCLSHARKSTQIKLMRNVMVIILILHGYYPHITWHYVLRSNIDSLLCANELIQFIIATRFVVIQM